MLAAMSVPVTLPARRFADGTIVPALGQGTWRMGENAERADAEVDALVAGIELGMTLIDTAEMYGDGGAERVVGRAIRGRRDGVFVVSKVYPQHAGRKSLVAACERSLARLGTDHLDLYLLHWRGGIQLDETVAAFDSLVRAGKILRWGVSNFDAADLTELAAVAGGDACGTNQVCYHLDARGIEWDLLPWMRARAMPMMAYSPFAQGELLGDPRLREIARRTGRTAAALALAWVMRTPDVIAIPQSCDVAHLRANCAAAFAGLDDALVAALDAAFPPPRKATPLTVL
jgi:diketogulonate reductase-like aldo/keto reductase